jgi:hypothetical protein
MKQTWCMIIHCILSLVLGFFMYLLFRSNTLLHSILGVSPFAGLQNSVVHTKGILNHIIFSLPSGLWTYSLMWGILMIWKSESKRGILISASLVLFTALLVEIMQRVNPRFGTFDMWDIIFSLAFEIIAIFIWKGTSLCRTKEKNYHEKKC